MPLLQPSFRGRLRLFFAVIVIVPIIAVGFVLFQLLDATDELERTRRCRRRRRPRPNMYEIKREDAMAPRGPSGRRRARDGARRRAMRRGPRGGWISSRGGSARSGSCSTVDGLRDVRDRHADGDRRRVRRAQDAERDATSARSRSRRSPRRTTRSRSRRLLEVQVRVDRDGAVLASTLPGAATTSRLPTRGRADVTAGGDDYRMTWFTAEEPDGQVTIVQPARPGIEPRSTRALVAGHRAGRSGSSCSRSSSP